MTTQVSETESRMAAYRAAERETYADGVEKRMRAALAGDPDHLAAVRSAWSEVEKDIMERFRAVAREKGKDGPKVFEVHHEIAVGKECFLIRLDRSDAPEAAADYTRRRLGLVGDQQAFIADQMEMSRREDLTPF